MLASGVRLGTADAKVVIVMFSDFECPFCKRFDATVREVLDEHPDDVAFVYVHYPLTQHRFAIPAARAAECAAEEGRFFDVAEVLFEKQDSLGLKSWGSYGAEAGVTDTLQFTRCAMNGIPVQRIEAGILLGKELGVRGTPTVLINGWRLPNAPGSAEVEGIIGRILTGNQPFAVDAGNRPR